MGFLDGLLGRSKPAKADLDVLFRVPQAALTLQAEGFAFSGRGAVCFRDADGRADDELIASAQEMIRTDPDASVELLHDEFGFTWLEVTRPTGDVSGLVTDLHAVNSTLADHGFDAGLLCSTVVFEQDGRRLALVYLFKRGTFYPFVPDPAAARRRDNPVELQIRALVEGDIPIEADLGRWLAIWGAPGL
ncbi:PspA-associated protein PspAB [Aeromicrobium sp. 179-A 4D2 NHS]|uniref:PspA-associated protein PspAB n=1 Tax=Aeromicrobium sp. 179-A 4D2 NHS TaxID=3142375 RepID=UPI0039A35DAA